MGLFKKNDELFEIMSKNRRHSASGGGGGGGGGGETSQIRHRLSTTSIPVRRPVSGGFGPRLARPSSDEPDLFELDGDALIIVDDDWAEAGLNEQGENKIFSIR